MRNFLKSAIVALVALALPLVANAQTPNPKNLIVNGEALFGQTGTATLTGINTTATYGADGFAVFSNNASASVVAGRSTANLPTGFQQAFSLQRTAANTNTTQACMVQEIESARIIPLQGQQMVFSSYLAVGATYSAAGAIAQYNVIGGTGTDQGLSSLIAATWTGQANIVTNQSSGALLQSYGRTGVAFTVPATVTELAVEICFTPVGTASSTTDVLFATGAQLEIQQGACPAIPGSAGYAAQVAQACATQYEHKPIELEGFQVNRYFLQVNEANVAGLNSSCYVQGANVQVCVLSLPVPMRIAPVTTITAGGLQMVIDGAAATAIVTGAGTASAANSPFTANWTFANTTTAAVHSVALRGSLTTGLLAASARF